MSASSLFRTLRRLVPTKQRRLFDPSYNDLLQEHLNADGRQGVTFGFRVLTLVAQCHALWLRDAGQRVLARPRLAHSRRRSSMLGLVANTLYDMRLAIRRLVKRPGFTLAAVGTLALGIGANTTIFSVVQGVLFRPLPYPDADRLVGVYRVRPNWSTSPARLNGVYAVPFQVLRDWDELTPVFTHVGGYANWWFTFTGGDRPERIVGANATSETFTALGAQPLLGRLLGPEDDRVGAPPVAILSHRLWQRRFGADSAIVGSSVVLNSVLHTVVGVMPPDFLFPGYGDHQLWATFEDELKEAGRSAAFLQVVGRLAQGVSLDAARRAMDAVNRRIVELHPDEDAYRVVLVPRKELLVAESRPALTLLSGAVGLVLLIACANIANLLLVRASERRREIGVRHALGAGRGRLFVEQLGESAALSAVGAVVGYFLAVVGVRPLVAMFPVDLPRASEIGVDHRALAFAAALALLTGFLTGTLPAIRSAGSSMADALRDVGRTSAGGRQRNRTHAALVISEIALAFVLLAGAGLFLKSFARLTSVDPGFTSENLLTVPVNLPGTYRTSNDATRAFFRDVTERLAALPGVEMVAQVNQMPLSGQGSSFPPTFIETSSGVVENNVHEAVVTPSYFGAMDIPLVAGRLLASDDRQGAPTVAVINQTMARRYWPDEDPIGRRLKIGAAVGDTTWATVVGVVGDIRYALSSRPFSEYYVPFDQRPVSYQTIVIKTALDVPAVAGAARAAVRAVDPDVPTRVSRLDDLIGASTAVARSRFAILVIGFLAGVAALLAILGVYGVLAYTVTQRTREIGIRIALGAGRENVLGTVMQRGLLMAGTGVAIGLGLALVTVRVTESLLYEVSPTDVPTLAIVALLVAVAALAASYVPARRATRVDPVRTLRQE
jgi:putative ABC transport system permease protein